MNDGFDHLAPIYEALFPARPAQLDLIEKTRPAAAPATFIDLACGSGTQLEALCDRGLDVYGLDLAPSMLSRLRERRPDLAHRVRVGDMRAADRLLGEVLPGPAGLVYSIGNSLALLGAREALLETLFTIRRLLHRKGAAVFQVINFDRILDQRLLSFPPLEKKGPAGEALLLERSFRPNAGATLDFEARLLIDGELRDEKCNRLLVLRQEDFAGLLEEAGFGPLIWIGDYDGRPWSPEAPATIVTTRLRN